ncbi:MAG TPA: hypothetical protein VLE26_04335 [Alphaproteobacteria bacterium]|nr:hypothetical protein [Alphaproteobacteria bacterium]
MDGSMGYGSQWGLSMEIRTIAAVLNGNLVFALYLAAWGTPTVSIAAVEIALALGAGASTFYALRRLPTPRWLARLGAGPANEHAPARL